jgi:LytS/YehU family sensor histidine kinase
MNPHFLFNTLNTVASLVRTDQTAAEATVENLAVVLRRTLDRSRRVLSTVDDEVDHLAAYISVAKQRFEDRLQVHWAVDPRARGVLLPTMTLQPLVENALKHGLGARMEGGALHIGVQLERPTGRPARRSSEDLRDLDHGTRSDGEGADPRAAGPDNAEAAGSTDAAGVADRLVLEVADDGPGFPRNHTEGTGLSNLRARLRTLYGDDAELIIDRGVSGSRVVVSLPALRSRDDALRLSSTRLSAAARVPVTSRTSS